MSEWVYENGTSFLVLHDASTGDEIIVNPRFIEAVEKNEIHIYGHAIYPKEDYATIKNLIIKALNMRVDE